MLSLMAGLLAALSVSAQPSEGSARYVPVPEPVDIGDLLVGAWMCPLWRQGSRNGKEWDPIVPYPERRPLLGWYDEGSPEVTDWEITWAVSHGISFFVPCWYRQRDNLGKPVESVLEHWVRDGLANARYRDQIRFAILWENSNHIASGVASQQDLLDNLMPYWIAQFFTRSNYLVLDGKPVLFIYSVRKLVSDLGGVEATREAVEAMRRACCEAGFAGLTVIGVHNARPDDPLEQMSAIGLDCVSSYHWPTFAGRMPKVWDGAGLIGAQEGCWRTQESSASLPSIVTVSMGWDDRPWGGRPGWRLTPDEFGRLCRRAKAFVQERQAPGHAGRMVLVDNWNEFGEGHYVFPHQEHGFGYLDAIRSAFGNGPQAHTDAVPEHLGLGPYDSLFTGR